jgi:uncharacterized membrane protein
MAGLRSKHNVYMSIPMLFFMVAPHTFTLAWSHALNWAWAGVVVLVGWGVAKFLYTKANSPAPLKAP